MAKKDRKFIAGSGRIYIFDDGGSVINCFLKLDDLKACPVTPKGYIRIVLAEKPEPDQFGNTHYAYQDDFVPKEVTKTEKSPPPETNPADNETDDLPF